MAEITHFKDKKEMARRLADLERSPVVYVKPFKASSLRIAKKKSKSLKKKTERLYSPLGDYTHGGHIIYSDNGGYTIQDGYSWR